jgi:phage tail-like protein
VPNETPYYPPVGFHFEVTIDGIGDSSSIDIQFQEVSGLNAEIGLETIKEGGENRFEHRLPGRSKYGNLVLKRGLVEMFDSNAYLWFQDAVTGVAFDPQTVTIKLMTQDDDGFFPLSEWSFVRAYPVKWSVSSFKATENAIVIDTLELAYQFFTRDL